MIIVGVDAIFERMFFFFFNFLFGMSVITFRFFQFRDSLFHIHHTESLLLNLLHFQTFYYTHSFNSKYPMAVLLYWYFFVIIFVCFSLFFFFK